MISIEIFTFVRYLLATYCLKKNFIQWNMAHSFIKAPLKRKIMHNYLKRYSLSSKME